MKAFFSINAGLITLAMFSAAQENIPDAAPIADGPLVANPELDTLDMAANAPTTDENYKKGVLMTLDKAAKALDALHVEEIEALGKPFDPNFMNAVQQIPAPDGQESGTVITVYQKGYKLGDVMNAWRLTLVGEGKGPGMFDISAFLGKDETIARMRRAIDTLG